MESPRMYEEGSPDNTRKDLYKLPSSVFNFGDDNQQHRAVLDPELENVVDLEELINSDLSTLESVSGHLTIDNFLPPCDLELLESGHPFVNQNISKFVPDTVVSACMTNFNEGQSNNSGANGHQTATIKTEDLDLTPCQSTGRARNPSSSASSCSDYSSRSISPKSPVVYECRKPGRKPSAGGPVRNRKREPPKDTPEYYEKRARNNVAVRKSREKAKLRQGETEERVSLLTSENERLQKKVDLLSKELNVLKSLFINVGASLPDNFEEILRS